MKKIAVIGAGPAGMIAAGAAAESGCKVYLIEKNDKFGKKLRITGKGRCNITNATDISEFFSQIPVNSKFLYSALYTFTNDSIIELLSRYGVKTKVERGQRVFPESDNAHDVADALRKYALHKNTEWIKGEVKDIIVKDGKVTGVNVGGKSIIADAVIVATGGVSYPRTGSTGDGLRMAKSVGHTIVKPKPSLIPIETKEGWVKQLMGLSLKNVGVSAYRNGKKIYDDFGEMLFTHFGVSGPVILSMSSHIRDLSDAEYKISIDLKPKLSLEVLDKRILSDFEKFCNKHLVNSLDELLPKALIPVIIERVGIDPHTPVNTITKMQRQALVQELKSLTLTAVRFRPVSEAIITSGGVNVKEVNPSTMESKLVSGLYFAGEVLDVDAYTGGYNLQIAYSTGYLAGMNASGSF